MPLVAPYHALPPILREFAAVNQIRGRRGGAEDQARISADLDLFKTGRRLIGGQPAHTA